MKRWQALAAACVWGLSVQAASAAFIDTTITFSDIPVAQWSAVPASYQPVSGLGIAWSGTARYGTTEFAQDHTKSVDSAATSADIGNRAINPVLGAVLTWTMTFDQAVSVPSLWLRPANGGQTVTLKGYTNVGDSSAAVTVTLPATSWSDGGWNGSNTTGVWLQVTGLGSTPIKLLEFSSKNTGWTNNTTGVFADDIRVVPVPEPTAAGLMGVALVVPLVARRRRA